MTPLKAASRAYVNAGSGDEKTGRTAYDQWRERDQLEADDAMREALMALAEAELDEETVEAGVRKGPLSRRAPDYEADTINSFRAILHHLATEGKP